MLSSILNAIIPGRRHRKKMDHSKFSPPSPIMPSNEIRRLSGDSTTATGRSTLPMPEIIPHVKRRYGTSSRPSIDSRHLSWINGANITKFPSGSQTEILKSFIATVDDEVSVPAGSIVSAIYKDTTGQWIYVKRIDGQHGYVPDFICSLLIPPPSDDSPPPVLEKPKISRRKSQQIKRELKKFHKREFEKRAEQLLQNHATAAFTSDTSSKLPNRFGSAIGHSARFLKTASMDRLQVKATRRQPAKNGIGSVSAATAAAICAVAADRNRRNYVSASGLVTLERAKPRRLPTAAERQFAMNENLRRFLSSLPQFPALPIDNEAEDSDDRPLNDTTIEQDDEDDGGKSSRDIRYARLKSVSHVNLAERDDDGESDASGLELAKKITIKMKSGKVQRQLSTSTPDFAADFGLAKSSPPEPPPKPHLKSAASVSRLYNPAGKQQQQSYTVQRQKRAINPAPHYSTSSLARPSHWRPAEPIIHELVAIQDFRAETKIDLDVRRGDRLSTVFSAVNGWIYATHSTSKQQGFIPSSAVMLVNESS